MGTGTPSQRAALAAIHCSAEEEFMKPQLRTAVQQMAGLHAAEKKDKVCRVIMKIVYSFVMREGGLPLLVIREAHFTIRLTFLLFKQDELKEEKCKGPVSHLCVVGSPERTRHQTKMFWLKKPAAV
jgi:hypothetical protein